MNQRLGKYITQKIAGESYKSYVPPKLPLEPAVDLIRLYPYLEKATVALAELNSIHKAIPNTSLFIYMYVCKEALLSSQIEGTQSSFSDLMLFEHHQKLPYIVCYYKRQLTCGKMLPRKRDLRKALY